MIVGPCGEPIGDGHGFFQTWYGGLLDRTTVTEIICVALEVGTVESDTGVVISSRDVMRIWIFLGVMDLDSAWAAYRGRCPVSLDGEGISSAYRDPLSPTVVLSPYSTLLSSL